jgi:hypothetical protein
MADFGDRVLDKYLRAVARNNTAKYRVMSDEDLLSTRVSDTLFIFGCGTSVNSISHSEWQRFRKSGQTCAFNHFYYQDFIAIDYYIAKECFRKPNIIELKWRKQLVNDITLHFRKKENLSAIFLLSDNLNRIGSSMLIGASIIPENSRIYYFHFSSTEDFSPPGASLREGLAHGFATLMDAINFGYIMNFRRIIFVGVDLYDRRYFYLDNDQVPEKDKRRGARASEKHNTADKVLFHIRQWKSFLSKKEIEMFVYNPNSLLSEIMPVISAKDI